MRITNSGNVGIGTTNPLSKLHVYGGNATLWGITLGYGTNAAIITTDDNTKPISFQIANTEYMKICNNGTVGINTTNTHGYQFAVNGSAIATSMTVQGYTSWPDYVFKPTYTLPSLTEVKTYIDQNHHLPEIPSAEQIKKDGLNLGEMNKLLVKKVEELTLYLIEKDRHEKKEYNTINELQQEVRQLKQQMQLLIKADSKKLSKKTKANTLYPSKNTSVRTILILAEYFC